MSSKDNLAQKNKELLNKSIKRVAQPVKRADELNKLDLERFSEAVVKEYGKTIVLLGKE